MNTISGKYIESLYNLTQIKLPETAILQAKKCLLDYLGVTLAGSKILEEKASKYLSFAEKQAGNISVIGFRRKSNLYNAALINGMSAHIAELDDGSRHGGIHLGAPIISAILPVVEEYNLTGQDLIRAIIVGYEAAIRLASAIQPSHRNNGYHATTTCGTIGVAIAISAALGFTKQEMSNTLSAAATSASGMLNVTKGDSELKVFNSGKASVSGIIAAQIAKAGFRGIEDVLSGDWGLINMMTDKSNLSLIEKLPGDKLGIEMIYMKPYAACRHSHTAIEAALYFKQNFSIKPEQIEEVRISTYHQAANGHEHNDIKGSTDAKLSTPYGVAVALIQGKVDIEEYSQESLNNPRIRELTKKVKVEADDNLTALIPEKRVAIVNILTTDKKNYSYRVDLAKGEPENPLTDNEIINKFKRLALFGGKSVQDSNYIAENVWNIENKLSEILKRL